MNAGYFNAQVRGHLGVTLGQDACRAGKRYAAENLRDNEKNLLCKSLRNNPINLALRNADLMLLTTLGI
ncbi:hypothetical protein Barb6XT_01972 [Bacteroidales bacterium Barb6XT]|nr:hypothetical protein Barb6XT_01972 [Bacteroidales bacterium Barb6XT]